MYMHTCLYIAVINTLLLFISPCTRQTSLFPVGENLRDLSRTFCKPELPLLGFCLEFNLTDAHGGTTIREVPVNLVANGIFPKIYLLSQVTKDSRFEKVFGSHFLVAISCEIANAVLNILTASVST